MFWDRASCSREEMVLEKGIMRGSRWACVRLREAQRGSRRHPKAQDSFLFLVFESSVMASAALRLSPGCRCSSPSTRSWLYDLRNCLTQCAF